MSPSAPTPAAHALAETLLSEWEHRTRAAFTPPYLAGRPLTLARFAALCELVLMASDVNINADDARTTLAPATSFGVATAAISGPNRAARLVAAIQFHHHGPVPTGPASTILLGINSRFDATLDMDELTFITESVQNALGEYAEMIFGCGLYDDTSAPELRMCLLVGYGGPA